MFDTKLTHTEASRLAFAIFYDYLQAFQRLADSRSIILPYELIDFKKFIDTQQKSVRNRTSSFLQESASSLSSTTTEVREGKTQPGQTFIWVSAGLIEANIDTYLRNNPLPPRVYSLLKNLWTAANTTRDELASDTLSPITTLEQYNKTLSPRLPQCALDYLDVLSPKKVPASTFINPSELPQVPEEQKQPPASTTIAPSELSDEQKQQVNIIFSRMIKAARWRSRTTLFGIEFNKLDSRIERWLESINGDNPSDRARHLFTMMSKLMENQDPELSKPNNPYNKLREFFKTAQDAVIYKHLYTPSTEQLTVDLNTPIGKALFTGPHLFGFRHAAFFRTSKILGNNQTYIDAAALEDAIDNDVPLSGKLQDPNRKGSSANELSILRTGYALQELRATK